MPWNKDGSRKNYKKKSGVSSKGTGMVKEKYTDASGRKVKVKTKYKKGSTVSQKVKTRGGGFKSKFKAKGAQIKGYEVNNPF